MDFNAILSGAKQRLEDSDPGKMSHVMQTWDAVNWNPCEEQSVPKVGALVAANDAKKVHLFPYLSELYARDPQEAICEVLCAFGEVLFDAASEHAKERWE